MRKSFKYWTRDDLFTEIGLDRTDKNTVLDQWLNNDAFVEAQEVTLLEHISKRAEPYIDNWNEVELREKFIYT